MLACGRSQTASVLHCLSPRLHVTWYVTLLATDVCRVFRAGGFSKFSSTYPHLCSKLSDIQPGGVTSRGSLAPLTLSSLSISSPDDDTQRQKHHDGSQPVQIKPHLYLGNARNAADSDTLQRFGVTHVLNVTANVENKFEGQFHYKRIPIHDNWTQDISSHFEEAIAFIGESHGIKIMH